MWAGDEKIITHGLKLDNLKVKNKEQKFWTNLAMNNSILYCKLHTELCYKRDSIVLKQLNPVDKKGPKSFYT